MTEEKDICTVVDEDIAHGEAVWDASSYDDEAMEGLFYRLMEHYGNQIDGFTKGLRVIQSDEDTADRAKAYRENVKIMMERLNYWMGQGLWDYVGKEETLPHDSHFIKALIAPRCYLETNGYGDIWANPRGSYLSLLAAKEVWKFYGAEDKCACWYREGGHAHGWLDFNALFDFMDTDLHGTPLPDSITRLPYDDMELLHDWTAPAVR